jgi:hypothetical protein
MRASFTRGLTWVEILVLLAILGIMLGLLLPTILGKRESARQASCMYNLMQLGKALREYDSARTGLPPGVVDKTGPIRTEPEGYHVGWIVQLLPYMDEQSLPNIGGKPLYDCIDFSVGVYDSQNVPARKTTIPMLRCPSYSGGLPADAGMSNYAGCHHDVESPIDADNRGVLFLNSRITARDVPDASHTLFIGEKLGSAADLGWMSGTRATLRNTGTPPNMTEADDGSKPLDLAAWMAAEDDNRADAATKESGEIPDVLKVGGFGSMHPGVVHFLLGDLSLHTFSESVDRRVFQQFANRLQGQFQKLPPSAQPTQN